MAWLPLPPVSVYRPPQLRIMYRVADMLSSWRCGLSQCAGRLCCSSCAWSAADSLLAGQLLVPSFAFCEINAFYSIKVLTRIYSQHLRYFTTIRNYYVY